MSTTLKNYTLQPGSRVLVTGANGFMASNIVDLLLSLGYLVRGTVRTEKPWLNELFDLKYGTDRFETIVVQNLDDFDALLNAMNSVDAVVHVATDSNIFAATDVNKYIQHTIDHTETILKAAAEKSVKRVVLTSSSSAALVPQPGVEGIIVTKDSWNDAAVKTVRDPELPAAKNPMIMYSAAKTEGERAAWKWVDENKPGFVLNTVLPNMTFGRVLHREIPGSTMKWVADLLQGNHEVIQLLPEQHFIDVEDSARLHAIALLDASVQSERIFGFAAPYQWNDIIEVFKKLRPSNDKLPPVLENEPADLSQIVPAKRAEQLLQSFFNRPSFTGLEESLKNGIESLGY